MHRSLTLWFTSIDHPRAIVPIRRQMSPPSSFAALVNPIDPLNYAVTVLNKETKKESTQSHPGPNSPPSDCTHLPICQFRPITLHLERAGSTKSPSPSAIMMMISLFMGYNVPSFSTSILDTGRARVRKRNDFLFVFYGSRLGRFWAINGPRIWHFRNIIGCLNGELKVG